MAAPLPPDLPKPDDDGAAGHLPGRFLPAVTLSATDGSTVALDKLQAGRTIIYCYPLTGRADVQLPEGWDAIPGARGCTNEACDFRDHHADLLAAGAAAVYGLSSQTSAYQAELVDRLHLPFPMLSDPDLQLAVDPGLPTLRTDTMTLYRRQTLVVRDGGIEHVFYPVFPPDRNAGEVLAWLRERESK
jgi:peroxiredoxin